MIPGPQILFLLAGALGAGGFLHTLKCLLQTPRK